MGIVIILGLVGVGYFVASQTGVIAKLTGAVSSVVALAPVTVGGVAPGQNFNPLAPISSAPMSTISGNSAQAGSALMAANMAAGAAGAPFTFGLSVAAAAIVNALLSAHYARLKGATNENTAALQIVPTFDSFVTKLVGMVNTGQVPKSTAAPALAAFDQQVYQQLRSLVNAPGTAWSDTAGMAGQCDKTCTVGCCLYFSDLGPPLSLLRYAMGDPTGKWGQGDPRLSADGRTVTVPKVYPGKYSKYTRASYALTITV